MHYLRSIITWIDSLESGSQFRQWAAILVKILGGVVSVGISVWGLVICVNTIGASTDLEMIPSIFVMIGSILELGIVIILATVLAMLFWNRSNKIRTLDNDPQFTLIFITVITVQLLGEVGFVGFIGTGIQTLIASIFGSGISKLLDTALREGNLLELFPIDPRGNVTFTSSVILFVIFVLSGIVLLIVAYFAAEKIDVQANIAESLNNIETKLVDEVTTSDN